MTTICATHPRYAEHDYPGHPENAERIRAVWRGLDESGLTARMRMLEAEAVDTDWVLSVHSATGQATTAVASTALVLPYLAVAAVCGAIAWFATRIPKGTS